MAGLKDILPDKRRVTVLVSLIFLLAIFMVPYFFVFIPANADNIRRQAFLKLDRAAQNIISKSDDTHNYFRNITSESICLDSDEMSRAECSSLGMDRLSFRIRFILCFVVPVWKILFGQPLSSEDEDSPDKCKTARVHELPVPDFIAPCLASGKRSIRCIPASTLLPANGQGQQRQNPLPGFPVRSGTGHRYRHV